MRDLDQGTQTDELEIVSENKGFTTILEMFHDAVKRFADKPAYTCMGASLTYAELDRLSANFANYLRSRGLKPGDRIAIQLPNILQFPVVLYGAFRAGLIVVNVNPLYTKTELKHLFDDAKPKALIVFANVAHVAAEAVKGSSVEDVIVTEIADLHPSGKRLLINSVVKWVKRMIPAYEFKNSTSLRAALREGNKAHGADHKPEPDDTLMLQYTGGTTGVAKAAVLNNANLVANLRQFAACVKDVTKVGEECWVAPMPLYHIFGFTLNNAFMLSHGGQSVLIPNPRDIPGMVKQLEGIPFTGFAGINTLFVGLTKSDEFARLDFSKLRFTVAGGAPLTKVAADAWQDVTGCVATEGYGLSETSPLVTLNRPGQQIPGSIGFPVLGTKVRVTDENDKEVEDGQSGELQVSGPQVMSGYWNRPDETATVMTQDGWFRTGDIAERAPDGSLKIVDRIKDMALVSGFNVFPVEIDEVASRMDGILECASIGVPDEKTGEAIWLFVVRSDQGLREDAILTFCREHLTSYKVPRRVHFVDDLPKSNVGKVLRRELRVQYADLFPKVDS